MRRLPLALPSRLPGRVVLLAALALGLAAEGRAAGLPPSSTLGAHEAAWRSGDAARIFSFYAEDFHGEGDVDSSSALRRRLYVLASKFRMEAKVDRKTLRAEGGGAQVEIELTFRGESTLPGAGAGSGTMRSRRLQTWARSGAEWRIAAEKILREEGEIRAGSAPPAISIDLPRSAAAASIVRGKGRFSAPPRASCVLTLRFTDLPGGNPEEGMRVAPGADGTFPIEFRSGSGSAPDYVTLLATCVEAGAPLPTGAAFVSRAVIREARAAADPGGAGKTGR